jgi:hypothetical protein
MNRVGAFLTAALAVLVVDSMTLAAPTGAYKPAQRREQESEGQASKASAEEGDKAAPPATYEQELQAAKEKRDKDLEAASIAGTDQRTLEKKKQEIFAQYAAIVAALRDKYEASLADGTASKPASRYNTKYKTGRDKGAGDDASSQKDDKKGGKSKKKYKDADADALFEAQERLDEENARHKAKLEQLNADLRQAQSSGDAKETRKADKAIEKENNTYSTRKGILERRVRDLGGTIAPPPAPAPAPSLKDAPPPPAPADAPAPPPAK